jgi:hypothetical protein
MTQAQLKSALATYLRAAAASVAALYLAGQTDPKVLLNAAVAGLVGPLAKALNPKDASYGIVKK